MQTRLSQWLFPLTFLLVPIFFVPLTMDIFTLPKQLLLMSITLLLLLIWGIQTVVKQQITMSASPLRFALLGFALVIGINLASNSEGRLESIVGPGSVYLLLSLWTYFLTMQDKKSMSMSLVYSFLGGSTILALHNLLQLTVLYRLHTLPLYMQSRAFSLTGGPLTSAILLALGAMISLYLVVKTTNLKIRPLLIGASILHLISFVALTFLLLPGHELAVVFFPYSASWNIMLDAMKSVRSFFFGVGLNNFPIFYQRVKPLFLNSTPFWNINPTSASSLPLQILTTTGVLGLLTFLSLPLIALKNTAEHTIFEKALALLLIFSGIALVFTTGSVILLVIFFTAIGVLAARPVSITKVNIPTSIVIAILALGCVGVIGYYTSRIYLAETDIAGAQQALVSNDGKTVYAKNLAAIQLVPTMTSYHLSYSQVNLSIAAALSQKNPLSDTDRGNITQLVSQAISEGKTATSLRPSDVGTWQNLGTIYRNLINVADGSDQFALQAYAQAVALDAGNPALRVDYGGLLYQVGQTTKTPEGQTNLYSQAVGQFQTAIQLKPDYANAYYNLSKILETVKDYTNSYQAMQKAISLLGPDSTDLSRATGELDALKAKLPKASPTPSPAPSHTPGASDLNSPSPLPSPISGGPITIPTSN